MNNEIEYAMEYHETTKHSEISLMTQRHYLDFDNRPIPFKIYTTNFPVYPLPSVFPQPMLDAISAISAINPSKSFAGKINTKDNNRIASSHSNEARELGIQDLAEILFFSAGITRVKKYDTATYFMRAASATGALYPIELYVVCRDIDAELEAGVYHFCPAEFSLIQIRRGDFRTYLAAAAINNEDHFSNSPLSLVLTSIAWRNAWKYQTRSYRHWFWDSGVIAANLLATTTAIGFDTELKMGFIDDKVNRLLRLDSRKEAAVIIANIGIQGGGLSSKDDEQIENVTEISETFPPSIRPLSEQEKNYSEIWKLHEASKLYSADEISQWISRTRLGRIGSPAQLTDKHTPTSPSEAGVLDMRPILLTSQQDSPPSPTNGNLAEVILMRGSTRRFSKDSIPFRTLSSILYSSTRGIALDFLGREGLSLIDVYFICNNVEDLPAGGYFFNRNSNTLDTLKTKTSREMSGYLCLGQSLFSQASAVFFLMTDLHKVLSALGNRGYRASQFEAGVIAGKIYLSAYAQGIGASGSTFFDDAVTEFFSPHAEKKSTMVAVGIGRPAYKALPGKILPVRLTRDHLLSARL
jgi:SagB-type dehydrogenase family enzyme